MTAPARADARAELRAQLTLAIPLASQQLGFQLMGAVDAAWLGRYSEAALAASGVGNSLLFAITSLGMGIVMGLDSVVPRALGANRPADARRYLSGGLRLAVLVGIVATVVVVAIAPLLSLAGVSRDVAREAQIYVALRALGIVPFLASIALRSYLAARHVTRPLVIAVIAGNVLNAALDPVLIFGIDALGLPPLGVAGAALATVLVNVLIVVVYRAGLRALDGDAPAIPAARADLVEIARYGGPIGGQLFAEIGIFGLATVLAATMGTLPAAGHTIALLVASFTFSAAVGIGAATAVRVGQAVGAGDLDAARRRGLVGLGVGLAVMAGSAVVFLAAPRPIARMFTADPAVLAAAAPLLMIAALFQLSDGAQAILTGALRGLGDTRSTLAANVIGHYGVGLAISLALGFGLGLGAPGLWWGLSAGLTATAIYLLVRFLAATGYDASGTGSDTGASTG